MGLIHHPIANGRQQASLSSHVAEEQALVRDHDVRRFRQLASTEHEARLSIERTLPPQALVTGGGYGAPRQRTEIDLQGIHVIAAGLLDEGEHPCDGRRLGLLLVHHHPHLRT